MRFKHSLSIVILVHSICSVVASRRHASRELVEDEIAKKSKDSGLVKPYQFGYQIKDKDGNVQHRHEESDENGVRRGSYGYLDANGVYRKVHYIADKNGFRVMQMKSNEPGLDPTAKAADVKSRDPDTSHTSPVLETRIPPKKVMSYERDLNNRLVKQVFQAEGQRAASREKAALSSHFIDNPSYTRQSDPGPYHDMAPPDRVLHNHPSAIPHFPDLNPVPSSFPYRFEKYPPAIRGQEHSHNLVQSSHSVPIYQAVKVRLQPDPYLKPLPLHAYRPTESNRTYNERDPPKSNYYHPLYSPPSIKNYTEPRSTYAPYFDSSRLKYHHDPRNEIATQRPATSTSGYLHPLQPIRPSIPILPNYDQTTRSPYKYHSFNTPNSIHNSLSYEKSGYDSQTREHRPYPPYTDPNYSPPSRPTVTPYVTYSSPAVTSESPYSSPSRERPRQYLDGPGPGAIVGSNRLEPSVFYSDDGVDSVKLANEFFSYAPHRTGPEEPPPDGPGSNSSPPPFEPYGPGPEWSSGSPPHLFPDNVRGVSADESARQRLASYYQNVKNATSASKVRTDEIPSVLLGIQSALGLETGVKLQASGSSDITEPDSNYTPSHYPSYQQILLLRKGLKNLLPLLATSTKLPTYAISASGSSQSAISVHRPSASDERFSSLISEPKSPSHTEGVLINDDNNRKFEAFDLHSSSVYQ